MIKGWGKDQYWGGNTDAQKQEQQQQLSLSVRLTEKGTEMLSESSKSWEPKRGSTPGSNNIDRCLTGLQPLPQNKNREKIVIPSPHILPVSPELSHRKPVHRELWSSHQGEAPWHPSRQRMDPGLRRAKRVTSTHILLKKKQPKNPEGY